MIDISLKGTGALHSPDKRDFIFGVDKVEPYDWSKPYTFDYKSIITSIRDQQNSLSCVGQTEAEVVDILTGQFGHSARYTYSQIHLDTGGAYVRDALSLGAKQIIQMLSEAADDPETEEHMRDKSGITVKTRDIPYVYAFVPLDIDSVAAAIRDHKAVHLAVQGDNEGWHTAYPIPPKNPVWGHDLCAVDMIMKNGKKYIKVLNSWGSDWGDSGYGYISEDYFNAGMVTVCMVYTDNYYKPNLQKYMIGYKLVGDVKVYIQVGDKYVWVQDWDSFTSLGGTTVSIVELNQDQFNKLPIDSGYGIHKLS